MGPDAMIFVFWMLSCKAAFTFCYFTLIKRLFISSSLSAIVVVSSAYLRLFIFILAILIPPCDSASPQRVGQNWMLELNWTEDNQSPTDSIVFFFTSPRLNCLKECTWKPLIKKRAIRKIIYFTSERLQSPCNLSSSTLKFQTPTPFFSALLSWWWGLEQWFWSPRK